MYDVYRPLPPFSHSNYIHTDFRQAPQRKKRGGGGWKSKRNRYICSFLIISVHQVSLFNEEDSKHTALQLQADDDRFCIFSLRFSANGDEILGGGNNGYLYVYDRFAQQRSLRIDAHEDDVNAVAFVDTATHILASGGDDGLVKIWDRRSLRESNPEPVGVFAGHSDGITFIDAKDDARHIISNCKDQSIKLWDLRKFASNRSIEQTKSAVRGQQWDYRWDTARSRGKFCF